MVNLSTILAPYPFLKSAFRPLPSGRGRLDDLGGAAGDPMAGASRCGVARGQPVPLSPRLQPAPHAVAMARARDLRGFDAHRAVALNSLG